MLDFNKYKNPMSLPPRPRAPKQLHPKATPGEIRAYADDVEAYDAALVDMKAKQSLYFAENHRLFLLFKEDVLEEYGLTGKRRATDIFNYAYNKSDSNYEATADMIGELVDLMKD